MLMQTVNTRYRQCHKPPCFDYRPVFVKQLTTRDFFIAFYASASTSILTHDFLIVIKSLL